MGSLSTLDTQIDPTTGTVKAKARFDNKALTLFPQQFVNIHLLVDTLLQSGGGAHHRGPPRRPGRLRLYRSAG